jgi:hypothetical protein
MVGSFPACCDRERPCGCRAANERDELAAIHSITSSARASSVGGSSARRIRRDDRANDAIAVF